MRKADRETESRKLIGEKLRQARMADDSPMTEEDAEYYRILAEARANHAARENSRKSAKRHVFTSAAVILLILAVAGGSFILGMQSDVRASADPDDERKVVQQGDNVVIGNGVSEDDENVGVEIERYKTIEEVPLDVASKISLLNCKEVMVQEINIRKSKGSLLVETIYEYKNNENVFVRQQTINKRTPMKIVLPQKEKEYKYNGITIFEEECKGGKEYSFIYEEFLYDVFIAEEAWMIKIEDILDGLV